MLILQFLCFSKPNMYQYQQISKSEALEAIPMVPSIPAVLPVVLEVVPAVLLHHLVPPAAFKSTSEYRVTQGYRKAVVQIWFGLFCFHNMWINSSGVYPPLHPSERSRIPARHSSQGLRAAATWERWPWTWWLRSRDPICAWQKPQENPCRACDKPPKRLPDCEKQDSLGLMKPRLQITVWPQFQTSCLMEMTHLLITCPKPSSGELYWWQHLTVGDRSKGGVSQRGRGCWEEGEVTATKCQTLLRCDHEVRFNSVAKVMLWWDQNWTLWP